MPRSYSYQLFERCAKISSKISSLFVGMTIADVLEASAILARRRHSSVVEQLFRKQQVLGSSPSVGSTPSFVLRKSICLELARFSRPSEPERKPANRDRRLCRGHGAVRHLDLGEGALVRGGIGREQRQPVECRDGNRVERHQPERQLSIRPGFRLLGADVKRLTSVTGSAAARYRWIRASMDARSRPCVDSRR